MDAKKVKTKNFYSFLFEKQQRMDWAILGGICLVSFIVLKICYPYPATMSDSGGYVVCAQQNVFSFYRPFGYSLFLRWIHFFSSSVHAIFVVQLFIYFASTSLLVFSVKYFFTPANKILWFSSIVFLVSSPTAFFMANAIMSDLLFSAMIYGMLTAFLFVVKRNSWPALLLFLLAMFCSLHIRYSAILFPVAFILLFLTVKGYIRWVSIAGIIVVTVIFHSQIRKDMKETTSFNQFSTGFDGWQLVNNAIHIIPFIDLPPSSIKNPRIREAHEFMLSCKEDILKTTQNGTSPSASFLWNSELPLKKYLQKTMMQRNYPYPRAWIYLGSQTYKEYGQYLITHYPVQFLRYYYLPNGIQMFYPSNFGIMTAYAPIDSNKDIVDWYHIPPDSDLNCKQDIYARFLNKATSIFHAIAWLIIAGITVWAIVKRKKINFNREEKILFWGIFLFGAISYSSIIFASPVELRYWLPMPCVQFYFCYTLLNKLAV